MKRIKIPWEKVEEAPFGISLLILLATPFVFAVVFNVGFPMILYPVGALFIIWNELGDDNEEA